MSFTDLLKELDARQIVLKLEADGRIGYTAPSGALTPDLVGTMKEHKAELIAALSSAPLTAAPQDEELPDLEFEAAPDPKPFIDIDLAGLKRLAEAWEFRGMPVWYGGIECNAGANCLVLGDLLRLETLEDEAERQEIMQRLAEFAETYE